jgi:7,8-dihydropterin-6-yl-methyl-4-(beta-D-ribofuranosyl)aminobenzene 5'-phosphate synthase
MSLGQRRKTALGVLAVLSVASTHVAVRRTSADQTEHGKVRQARVTVLSTMLADAGLGEWGFSALVEADGHKLLFDTGLNQDVVLRNAKALKLDLSDVEEVVLSHHHNDHTGGLLALRGELSKKSPQAISRAHVAPGIFTKRRRTGDEATEANPMIAIRPRYEAMGGSFVEHAVPIELYPGVWLTGPVPRPHPERNYSKKTLIETESGFAEDTLPEDQSLVLDTEQGLVVISGCGHSGMINTLEYARSAIRKAPIHAAIGGFHLYQADDEALAWTADKLKEMGLENLIGAHCTGLEATYTLRSKAGLARKTCVVGAVGASFTLGKGIDPRELAR